MLSSDPDRRSYVRFAFDDTHLSSSVYRDSQLPSFGVPELIIEPGNLDTGEDNNTLWFTAEGDLASERTILRKAQSMSDLDTRHMIHDESSDLDSPFRPHNHAVRSDYVKEEGPPRAIMTSDSADPWLEKDCLFIHSETCILSMVLERAD